MNGWPRIKSIIVRAMWCLFIIWILAVFTGFIFTFLPRHENSQSGLIGFTDDSAPQQHQLAALRQLRAASRQRQLALAQQRRQQQQPAAPQPRQHQLLAVQLQPQQARPHRHRHRQRQRQRQQRL
ncbi:unnamed protein product [Adineta steineri]|uniref:Uncharacterized protein n=2 Tax=Adineta steineri TaxID=433720 RepID=A0A814D884_9BILA|nr:unnamed protein product [Adineta steineri]